MLEKFEIIAKTFQGLEAVLAVELQTIGAENIKEGNGVVSYMGNKELVNALASSKLVGAMLDTPGGKALLMDPNAMAGVLKTNPGLINVLTNPVMLQALMNNPKTAGVVTQLTIGGAGR